MLHLGHLAKAYALKETPTLLARQQAKRRLKAAPAAAAKRRKPSHLHQLAAYGGSGAGGKARKDEGAWQRTQERLHAASEFSAAMPLH